MRARLNQVSTPNPEFGVDFDASARAMHQSALKGSLMVHETAFSTPAASRKSLGATLFERNTMLKTLKRKIALVAVAALGSAGLAVVAAPTANAAIAIGAKDLNLVQTGSTLGVKVAAGAADTAAARAGSNTIVISETASTVAGDAYDLYLSSSTTVAGIEDSNLVTIASASQARGAGTTDTAATPVRNVANYNGIATANKSVSITPGAGTTDIMHTTLTATLAAGTYILVGDPSPGDAVTTGGIIFATITVVAAGAPASVSWKQSTRQISTAAVDYATTFSVKDASGVSTVLVGAESVVLDIAPQTGVAASQVDLEDYTITADDIVATTGTNYPAEIDGNAGTAGGGSGTTVAGTTYTLYAQIVSGGAAVGAPASSTYTRVSNTAGLTGALSFFSDAAATTALTSIAGTPAVAVTNFYGQLKDSAGAVVVGATLTSSLTTLTDAALVTANVTDAAGVTPALNFTPAAGGTGSYNLSVSTGASSISASIPATVTAYGAIDALNTGITVTATNGNGLKTVTAGTAYTATNTTTAYSLVVTGLTASSTVKISGAQTVGGANLAPKYAGTTATGYAVTDSTGKLTTTVTVTSPVNANAFTIVVDADGNNTANATVTITYANAAAALTTTPATATTSFVAVSSSQTISAAVADQFGNFVTGGNVTIVNNSVPAGITAMTTAVKNVDAAGKADLTATIGATAGTYQFTITARDPNGTTVGTASVVTFTATADGAPGSVTLTAGGSEAGLGTYRTWVSPNGIVALSAVNVATGQAANPTADPIATTDTAAQALAKVGDYVTMTVSVKNAAGTGVDSVTVAAKGSAGVYIANATTGAPTSGTTKLSAMADTTGTTAGGGVATFHVVATKVGTNTVTFTVGSKSATASFTAETGLAIQSIARDVKLSSTTVAVKGNEITQVTATVTDAWGNPVSGVALAGVVTGAAGRFAGGGRTFSASTDAAGQLVFELTANATEKGAGTLTVTGTDAAGNITNADFRTGDLSVNVATLGKDNVNSVTATLAVTEATASAAQSAETTAIKADVKAVSDTVATLSKAVTTIQSSVTELTTSFTAQIKSLSSAIAKISRAIAALSKKIK